MKKNPAPLCRFLLAVAACAIANPSFAATDYSVKSPDGELMATVTLSDAGALSYKLNYKDQAVITDSALGFELRDKAPLKNGFEVIDSETASVDEKWEQPWGETKMVRDHHNELLLTLKETGDLQRTMKLRLRVFDEALAFRYEFPRQPNQDKFDIMDELTEFTFSGDHDTLWFEAYFAARYESLHKHTPLSGIADVDAGAAETPLTMQTESGLFISLHEAALTDYASMTLKYSGENKLKADLVPWSDGIKVKNAPEQTPWRTITVSPDVADLVESNLALNLNEPCKIENTSWLEPGKYAGIWWAIHIRKWAFQPGPKLGATTEHAKDYIDFAAKYGLVGVLVEGWNKTWLPKWTQGAPDFSFTEPNDSYDIEEVARYAREKGTRLVIHNETGGHIPNYEKQMEEAYAFYQKLGARAIKSGYVGKNPSNIRIDENGKEVKEWQHGQYMVNHFRKAVETAAKHQISLVVHEPIKDTGIRRTWPNMMTREGARGQEFNAWSKDGGNPPNHESALAYTRMLSGPMDFTPGVFDVTFNEYRINNRVNTTLCKQLALYVVIYSPLHMLTDLPENYEGHPVFKFLIDVPTDWEKTKFVAGDFGKTITLARQKRDSDEWFLGSITDEEPREIEIVLDFLADGVTYTAEVYEDGPKAHWENSPKEYLISSKTVTNRDMHLIKLAPGGGQAIRFIPLKQAE